MFGADAADAELGERAPGPAHRGREVAAAAGQLDQHRVEVRADLRRPACDGAAVEPDAGAAGRAVGGDRAGVGPEAVRRVLGGDPALQRGAVQPDVVLGQAEVGERLARGDPDLRLHEVDVGDLLGHRVLDLDPRVHLDEHVLAGARARGVEQELDGAGVDVADLLGERDRVRGRAPSRSAGSRFGAGAISTTFWCRRCTEQSRSNRCTVSPAASARICTSMWRGRSDGLLEEQRRVAERALGLAHRRLERLAQLRRVVDPAHAAPAAAGDGLGEDREADLLARPRRARRRPRTAPGDRSTGTPAARAASTARTLLPAISSTRGGGPMKVMPASAQALARSGFSDRKP